MIKSVLIFLFKTNFQTIKKINFYHCTIKYISFELTENQWLKCTIIIKLMVAKN